MKLNPTSSSLWISNLISAYPNPFEYLPIKFTVKNKSIPNKNKKKVTSEGNRIEEHIVQKGETLFSISKKYNTSISILKENPSIEIVLMDIMMPEMDGLEATKEIRKQFPSVQLPILAMTAFVFTGGDDKKIYEAGMDDFILKPFNPDSLYSKIYSLIKKF